MRVTKKTSQIDVGRLGWKWIERSVLQLLLLKQKEVELFFFVLVVSAQDESSVQQLIDTCIKDDDKLYLCVSSPTIKDKPVQIRPWRLSDADFVLDASLPLDPRKTVFVGGVPRPLKAGQ